MCGALGCVSAPCSLHAELLGGGGGVCPAGAGCPDLEGVAPGPQAAVGLGGATAPEAHAAAPTL